jgi:DNA-binding beta-propeller fold protein YncE
MTRNALVALLCAACATLMGCGGGSHGATPPAAGSASGAQSTGATTAQFVITVPHAASQPASASVRTPAYVASTTQSITINLTPHGSGTSLAGFPMTANLSSSTSGCVSSLVNLQCTITLTVAPANDDVTITTFDGANGSGNVLSAAQTVEITVLEGQTNTLPIALGGVPTGVKIVPFGGTTGGSQNLVFTLPLQGAGQLEVYGTDADANIILGAGAPSVTVTNSNASTYTVSGPATTTPNLINVTSLSGTAAGSITRLTATVSPVAGTGTGAVSTTVTLQAQTLPIIYAANYAFSKISVYDALGDVLSPPGFAGVSPYNITYDTANQLLYVLNDSGTAISAFDRNGNPQVLASSFPGLTLSVGLIYNPQNGLLYSIAFPSAAVSVFTQSGASTSVSPGTFSGLGYTYGPAYDPVNAWMYAAGGGAVEAWDANGNAQPLTGGFPGISQVEGVAYNAVTGNLYVACVYPSQILAYTPNGSSVSLGGPFTVDGQPNAIAADPASGNIYVSTNANTLSAYDQQGNLLWRTASDTDGAPGIVTVPPP